MEPESPGFPLKLAFLGCFPVLSVLLVVLGLDRLWELWIIVTASVMFFILGLNLGKTVQNHSSLKSSGAPFILYLFAWVGAVCLAAWTRKTPIVLALGGLLGPFLLRFVMSLLKKNNLSDRLERRNSCVWLVFVLSAAVPASMGLAQLNHVMSILPVIIYGGIFGWFGPEVLPRVFPGSSLPVLLPGSHLFIILSFYALLEICNPALKFLTPDWVIVVFLSYLACYTMLVSRCILEAFERPEGQKE